MSPGLDSSPSLLLARRTGHVPRNAQRVDIIPMCPLLPTKNGHALREREGMSIRGEAGRAEPRTPG